MLSSPVDGFGLGGKGLGSFLSSNTISKRLCRVIISISYLGRRLRNKRRITMAPKTHDAILILNTF